MPRYYCTTYVERATGWQRWYVDAENLDEAKEKYNDCVSVELDDEEVEVQSLSEPEWDDE